MLLEAPSAGPNQPTFYVAHLTADQATQLAAELSAPAMASASTPGAPLPYVLSWLSEQGTESLTGTFGGCPADARFLASCRERFSTPV